MYEQSDMSGLSQAELRELRVGAVVSTCSTRYSRTGRAISRDDLLIVLSVIIEDDWLELQHQVTIDIITSAGLDQLRWLWVRDVALRAR